MIVSPQSIGIGALILAIIAVCREAGVFEDMKASREERRAEKRRKRAAQKERSVKTYDHQWPEDDSDSATKTE